MPDGYEGAHLYFYHVRLTIPTKNEMDRMWALYRLFASRACQTLDVDTNSAPDFLAFTEHMANVARSEEA